MHLRSCVIRLRVRLNAGCCADVAWWSTFVQQWNGVSLFPDLPPDPSVILDASSSWGCGAFTTTSHQWFQLQWLPSWSTVNIAIKELIPVVVSAALWGREWTGSLVLFRSNNQAHAYRPGQLMTPTCHTCWNAYFFLKHTLALSIMHSILLAKICCACNIACKDMLCKTICWHSSGCTVVE